ncbi:hypothetical protein JZK55_21960 [Dissulfurispira thermophila]|uniref:Uracil-DNA glycosylase n=2 Tax=root TaxID=1 RepID=A0A7G1H382_9BACT|nr:uracil-DNA glycosylase [Dissulfurispira thermophila]BCB97274.1 hypothetical protein JZK55_21960 [Dissulfurispira thermophila]
MEQGKIDCFKCKHFYITWDKGFPYGCRAMGFKTKNMPSDEVYKASTIECLKYEEKGKNHTNIIR